MRTDKPTQGEGYYWLKDYQYEWQRKLAAASINDPMPVEVVLGSWSPSGDYIIVSDGTHIRLQQIIKGRWWKLELPEDNPLSQSNPNQALTKEKNNL